MAKEFVVLGFDSRELAEEARSLGAELDRERVLQLDGAALAYRRDDGRVELVQPMRLSQAGAASGAVAGTVLGMLMLEPGRAALFLILSVSADPQKAIDALRPLAPRVLHTTLDPAAEQRLLAAFTEPALRPGSTLPSPPSFGVTDHAVRRRGGREWTQPTS
jgi:uncharacterized membrane protein